MIDRNKERLAVVMLAGVQYLTGQMFDMQAITAHVAKVNDALPAGEHIYIGWDLAHAVRLLSFLFVPSDPQVVADSVAHINFFPPAGRQRPASDA